MTFVLVFVTKMSHCCSHEIWKVISLPLSLGHTLKPASLISLFAFGSAQSAYSLEVFGNPCAFRARMMSKLCIPEP